VLLTYVGSYQQYDQRDLYENTGTLENQNTLTQRPGRRPVYSELRPDRRRL